jgi:voltage-gated potassium channel
VAITAQLRALGIDRAWIFPVMNSPARIPARQQTPLAIVAAWQPEPESRPPEASSRLVRFSEIGIQVLIVYSIVTIALETMPELNHLTWLFNASEAIVVGLFTLEFVFRWLRAENKLTHPFRILSLVDLVAILPFYLSTGADLRAVRALSLLRIFKMSRYNRALRHLTDALAIVKRELMVFGFVANIVMLLAATGIYFAENEAQPDKFSSIPACMWWSVVTLTTVGYGDLIPITPLGKCFASLVMMMGIGVVAIPTGLISSAMTELARKNRQLKSGTV